MPLRDFTWWCAVEGQVWRGVRCSTLYTFFSLHGAHTESTTRRLESTLPKDHEDHIAEKGSIR